MKRLKCLLFTLAVGAVTVPATGDETSNVDYGQDSSSVTLDLMWSFEKATDGAVTHAVITGVRDSKAANPSGEISVPTSVIGSDSTGYIVRAIADSAFANQIGITLISIPTTVKTIGTNVFAGCTVLSTITVSESNPWFTSADGVLYDKDRRNLIACPATAESLSLPSSLTNICATAFVDCHRLTSVTIPSSVLSIGANAFTGCSLLESIVFKGNAPAADSSFCSDPDSVIVYKEKSSTGWDVAPWTSFDVRDTTAEPSDKVLSGDAGNLTWCYRVTADGGAELYNHGESAIPVGTDQSYTYDSQIKEWVGDGTLVIPTTLGGYPVTRIGAHAFSGCSAITTIVIPSSVTVIGDYAFEGCKGLEEITLPSSVTELGVSPFTDTWISSLELPANLKTVRGNPAAGCLNLDTITIDAKKNRYFSVVDNVLYNRKQTMLYGMQTFIEEFTVPATVTEIMSNAFASCTLLTEVTFLGNAPKLEDGGMALYADVDESLVTYTAAGTTGWDGNANSTNMPASGKWPVDGSSGRKIVSLYDPGDIGGDTPVETAFETDSNGTTWYYRIIDGVAEIYHDGGCAVRSDEAITSVSLPVTLGSYVVKGIGDCALSNLRGITSVTIPDTYEWIGSFAFSNCTTLSEMTIGNAITDIGRWPFYGTKIQTLSIPDSIENIDGNIGAGATMLTAITADDTQPYFASDNGLLYDKDKTILLACPATKSSVTLPSTLTAISEDAFYGCKLISGGDVEIGEVTWSYSTDGSGATVTGIAGATGTVTIPATLCGTPVTAIDSTAFNGCSNVTEFVSLSSSFTARNKCLYSADGTILVRVPDTLMLPHSKTVATDKYVITQYVGSEYTVTTNHTPVSAETAKVAGDITFESLLKDVVIIRNYAFRGCNVFTNGSENLSEKYDISQATASVPKVITTKTVKTTSYVTTLVLPDSVRKVEPLALEGSGIVFNGELPNITIDDYPYAVELAAISAEKAVELAEAEFLPLSSPYPDAVSDAEYRSYFAITATPVAGKAGYYAVTADLSPAAIGLSASEEQMAANISKITAGSTDSVTLSVKPGLFYSIYSCATAGGEYGRVDGRFANGTELELKMSRPSSESGFYRLEVTVTNPEN